MCRVCALLWGAGDLSSQKIEAGFCSSLIKRRRSNVRVCLLSYEQTGAGKGDDA